MKPLTDPIRHALLLLYAGARKKWPELVPDEQVQQAQLALAVAAVALGAQPSDPCALVARIAEQVRERNAFGEGARVALLCGDTCSGRGGPSCGAEGTVTMSLSDMEALVYFDLVPYEDDGYGYRVVRSSELQLAGDNDEAPWRSAMIRHGSRVEAAASR